MDCQATSSFLSRRKRDLAPAADTRALAGPAAAAAQRQGLAVQVLGSTHPVVELARRHQVSGKFLYQQADTRRHALTRAFEPEPTSDRGPLPPPRHQGLVAATDPGPGPDRPQPYRAVVELRRDLFDCRIALGTVHNVVPRRGTGAGDQRPVRPGPRSRGAHDEIFQASHPVLVGVDTTSTYCYLLSLEDHRDAETWGVRLLELVDQGFDPDATVADAGTGLRAGQALALPAVPCRGDVFHVLRDLEAVSGFLENRAL